MALREDEVGYLPVEQVLEKYPYLKPMSQFVLFTTEEDISKIKNSEKVKLPVSQRGSEEVSAKFLRRTLQDRNYYQYVYRFFKGEIPDFKVGYIKYGDVCGLVGYNKVQIIKGIEILVSENKFLLSEEEKTRYDNLRYFVSLEKYIEDNKDSNFEISIEGVQYSIPINLIFSFMKLSNEDFNKICSDEEIKNIYGIAKEYFIYAVQTYFTDNEFLDKVALSNAMYERYAEIASLQKIDTQAINCHLETTDEIFKKASITPELEETILNGIPIDASDLEKAIYIYIKMCKILTYDDEYYAVNQVGEATLKHQDINYISTITPTNNKVVCFEFNLIYSKFLNDLGIKFSSDYRGAIGESYGDGHVDLEFRSGKFLVNADAVTSILYGDMTRAKLNQPLVGLCCNNVNKQTQTEFNECMSRMYELIVKQEKQDDILKTGHSETFDKLLDEYSNITLNVKNVDVDEKLSILLSKVSLASMSCIDSMSYILQLRKILFDDEERKQNFGFSIIRDNEPIDQDRVATASAIFTLNESGFTNAPDSNRYYYFNSNGEFVAMTKKDLQMRFDEGTFEYIRKDDPKIPGIEVGGMKYDGTIAKA